MLVLKGFVRFLLTLGACRHWRTRVYEGKCYCPDCGRGLIYQWAVLRCQQCAFRLESRLWFGEISPVQRCCVHCGAEEVEIDWLSAPAYFQLHKAQLVLVEEESGDGLLEKAPWVVWAQEARHRRSRFVTPTLGGSGDVKGWPRLLAPAS